ncbi:MAG: glycosyltransferase [Rhizobiaceae bacterium]|nr:MAG: glycosyltransferase [Rhizobiaceae bacterium]
MPGRGVGDGVPVRRRGPGHSVPAPATLDGPVGPNAGNGVYREPSASGPLLRQGGGVMPALFPELEHWAPVLDRLGVADGVRVQAALRARVHGTTFQREILISGRVGEDAFYRSLADCLGVRFLPLVAPEDLVLQEKHALALLRRSPGVAPARVVDGGGQAATVLATDRLDIAAMRAWLSAAPALASRIRVATPSAVRQALLGRARASLSALAVSGLFERLPHCSAVIIANAWQGFLIGFGGFFAVAAAVLAPLETLIALQGFLSLFFFGCVLLRIMAMTVAAPPEPPPIEPFAARDLPVYSVLVALYREAGIVPELLVALGRLQWPRSKLEIKLVCESDDDDTIAAIRAHPLRPNIEVIEVPPAGPRTKPKALAYALPTVEGEFVVLYDAEDKPHPLQLLEAWQRFRTGGPDLACLQAPLEISNGNAGPIARLFALEYAALFRGLLPFLARRRLVLPLGGTSNHFRRSLLEEVGGWDPHNVTEDADLAIRLSRHGYRTETISRPTREAAPTDFATWLPQRTRWFKGWLLTWLVHMRDPVRLLRELGLGSFIVSQILFVGMVLSAFAHPIMVATIFALAARFAAGYPLSTRQHGLLAVDAVNIACGYASFVLLGWQTLTRNERRGFWKAVVFTPVYWLMLSLAALKSVVQLWRAPYFWAKTHHPPRRGASAGSIAAGLSPSPAPGMPVLRR